MDKKLVTIAIHQYEKATIAKGVLEQRGIPVILDEITQDLPQGKMSLGYHIQVPEQYVNTALTLLGTSKALSYTDQGVFTNDDGKLRILVAVDFSEYTLKTCAAAFDLAKLIDAKVKILNVFNNLRYPLHMPFADIVRGDEQTSILNKARGNMLILCQEIDKKIENGEIPSINYSFSLREGIVEEEIENYIEEYKPILLVVGTKGGNNSKNMMGNVTADIIEITNIPVLAVPLESVVDNVRDIQHIAYLTNVDKRDLLSFEALISQLSTFRKDLKVTLVHVTRSEEASRFSEEQLAQINKNLQEKYPTVNVCYKIFNSGDMINAVEDFVKEEEVGMLCVNTRRRNILGRIFIPSMSRKLLNNINVLLMVLRD